MPFPLPERLETASGKPRRLGVEIEFAGISLDRISELVAELYGGTVEPKNRFVHRVRGTCWGDFQVEIDTALLKDRAYEPYLEAVGFNMQEQHYRDRVDDVIARVAGTVVPHEVVSPPIPMPEVGRLEELRERLQKAGAKGTRSSVLYAFGLHLNPELTDTSTATLLAHLRAFMLLWDWLHTRSEIDWSRRLTPYITEFPHRYRQLIVDPDYQPDMQSLLANYLTYNPTRNRALDMLPIFRELMGNAAVRGVPEAALVRPRPAFHYRLPNCRIEDPDWTLAQEWQGWVMVEWLAARPERMAEMGRTWLDRNPPAFSSTDRQWAAESEDWLIP